MPARRTSPAQRPDRFTRGNRLDRTAGKTSSSGSGHAVHAANTLIAPPTGRAVIMRDFIIK
jgi:hypothetical protein